MPSFARELIRKIMFRPYRYWARFQLRRFVGTTRSLQHLQRHVLLDRLARNRDSRFGRDHNFAGISSVDDFRHRVPISNYEYYVPYIEQMKAGKSDALLGSDQKLAMFALTSGTISARKFIPITDEFIECFRRGWVIWGGKACMDHYGLVYGSILQLASDWDEFRTDAGTPCGSVSGLLAKLQSPIVRRCYCIPPEVGRIKDVAARHYTTLRLSVPCNVTFLTTANPSTIVNLVRLGDSEKQTLVRDIADGTLSDRFAVPSHIRESLCDRIASPNPRRARELESIIARTGSLLPKDYWPQLKMLGNWTGGAVRAYLRHYPALFGSAPVRDIGLIASEGRMTIPLEPGTTGGVLDPTVNYYEFIPESEIESPSPTILEAHELVEGQSYYILLTTPSGFCRYNIYDLVRVIGKLNEAPVLEFLNKGAHFASITGEKLAESQVTRAVDTTLGEMSKSLTAFTLAPVWDDVLPYYALLVERTDVSSAEQGERLASGVDRGLCRLNSEYASKRETRRLGSVRLGFLPPGSWSEFCRKRLAERGGSLEQYKHPCLVNDFEFVGRMRADLQHASDSISESDAALNSSAGNRSTSSTRSTRS